MMCLCIKQSQSLVNVSLLKACARSHDCSLFCIKKCKHLKCKVSYNIKQPQWECKYLRNEFDYRKVHGIMNTSGLLQSQCTLTLQETRIIHDSINRPKIEFITYIYILYYQSSINFQFSPILDCFPVVLN